MIGPGYELAVSDINLEPGQKDTLTFSADGRSISYQTTSSESPLIELGVDGPNVDYAFALQGVDMEGGGTLNVALGTAEGELTIDTTGIKGRPTFDLTIEREGRNDDDEFEHNGVTLDAGERATLEYDDFDQEGEGIQLETERNGARDTETITDVEEPGGEGPGAGGDEEEE